MLQHFDELLWIRHNVEIFNLFFLFGIRCTSCPSIGSGIFSEYQYFFSHGLLLHHLWGFNYIFLFLFQLVVLIYAATLTAISDLVNDFTLT
jgi:hypothetical protein